MDEGSHDRRIRLLRHGAPIDDGYASQPGALDTLGDVWASVKPGPGKERLVDAKVAATAPTVFRTRWTKQFDPNQPTGLNPKDRIEYPIASGRQFEIVSVLEIGLQDEIELVGTRKAD